jgi:hypothetical protein
MRRRRRKMFTNGKRMRRKNMTAARMLRRMRIDFKKAGF